MRPWQIAATLLCGFLLGGFAHLWVVSDVGYNALINAGQSGFGWNTKSISVTFDLGIFLYGVGLLPVVLSPFIAILVIILEWWYRRAFPFQRPQLRVLVSCTAFALLGALGAITLNQHEITENYVYYAATGQPFESRTIALALPAMQAFTADCQRALLFLLLLTLVAWGSTRWHRQRRTPRPAVARPHGGSR